LSKKKNVFWGVFLSYSHYGLRMRYETGIIAKNAGKFLAERIFNALRRDDVMASVVLLCN